MAGKYVIVGRLESGGMGDVYDAWQKDLSRPVAIKLLRAEIVGDPAMFLRFRREAEAAASLGHPNIVRVLDFRNDPGEQPMLIMEKLEGRSLRSLLAEEKTLVPQRATFIGLQILSALAAAHDANIVHRDVKPGNVFILKTFAVRDFVKVLDFGIAKVLEPSGGAVLTELGQVLGTASYMAPEQARGVQVDGRADLFSVGGILFEALSGRRPRELGKTALVDVATKPCLKLLAVAPLVDPQLAAVIDRALALDRNARFPSAAAMAAALAPFGPQELIDVGRTDGEATVRDSAFASLEYATTATGTPNTPVAPTEDDATPLLATVDDPAPLSATQDDPPRALTASTKRSAGVGEPQPPSAPPAPRTSYQPPLLRQPSIPAPAYRPLPAPVPSSRWSGAFWALPIVIAVLVAIATGVFLFTDLRAPSERDLVSKSVPARCVLPSTCTGVVLTADDQLAVCTPFSVGQLRTGDLVFVGSGTAHPRRFVETGSAGRIHLETASGSREDVEPKEVRGLYCSP
jgi:eukaryotic-like serine/threonine-protein kinase